MNVVLASTIWPLETYCSESALELVLLPLSFGLALVTETVTQSPNWCFSAIVLDPFLVHLFIIPVVVPTSQSLNNDSRGDPVVIPSNPHVSIYWSARN